MRHLLLGLVFSVLSFGAVWAQSEEIEGVIGSQIEAFETEDLALAFRFASPGIQRIFNNPRNFGAMVKGGYPMVWRPGEVRFLELGEQDGLVFQDVEIVDTSGRVHVLRYQMIQYAGEWRINGVNLLKTAGFSA